MSSPSSPLMLSLATVFAILGIVLVAVAFGTNDWQKIRVRDDVLRDANDNDAALKAAFDTFGGIEVSDLFVDRTYGIFRECFPSNDIPKSASHFYTSPLGASCIGRGKDYQIPENRAQTGRYSDIEKTRMHLLRTQVAFYIAGLVFLLLCLLVGIVGCWRRSSALILATGILSLVSTLFLAASMAVWHGIDYLEREVIRDRPFYQSWPEILKAATTFEYGWSYMVSWIGIGFILASSILMLLAYRSMRSEERAEYEKHAGPYMMPPTFYDKQTMMYSNGYSSGYPPNYGSGYSNYGGYNSYGNGSYNPYAGYVAYGR